MSQDNKPQFILNNVVLNGSALQEVGDVTDPVYCSNSKEAITLNFEDFKTDKDFVNVWLYLTRMAREQYRKKLNDAAAKPSK